MKSRMGSCRFHRRLQEWRNHHWVRDSHRNEAFRTKLWRALGNPGEGAVLRAVQGSGGLVAVGARAVWGGVQRGQAEGTQPQTLIFVGGVLLGLMVGEGRGREANFSPLHPFTKSQRKTRKAAKSGKPKKKT